MAEEQGSIVTLIDEGGKEVAFDVLLCFDYEGRRYVALLPVDKVEGVGDDEVVLLEAVREGNTEQYVFIDNPILLDEVFNEFTELFEEVIAENDGEDEDEENE